MKNCTKCSNELKENIKFCGKCGNKVEEQSNEEVKKVDKKIENKKIPDLKNHLEFLGYTVEVEKGGTGIEFLISTHENKPNLVITFGGEDMTFFSTTWTGLKKVKDIEQHKLLNNLIENSTLCQLFTKDDDTMRVSATYVGEYNKKSFSSFLEAYFNDNTRFLTNEEFKKLFMK